MCNMRARLFIFVISLQIYLSHGQVPPRVSIPGAVLVSQHKPSPQFRQQRLQQPEPSLQQRPRRPQPNPFSAPVRPVIEEPEENIPQQPLQQSFLDDEVAKLGLAALQSAVRQSQSQQEEEEQPRQVQFRPERPVPLLRSDIREQVQRPQPILRQEPAPTRAPPRQEFRDEYVQRQQPQPVRQVQQVRQQVPQQQPQAFRQKVQPTRAQAPQYADAENTQRRKKPVVQILRKYRTDNPDGSITWGYENEDGTFKEETLGIDCITRGKYGYIDPDGVKREYSYETGLQCDEPEEEELAPLPPQQGKFAQAPRKQPQQQQQQQYRQQPAAAQY